MLILLICVLFVVRVLFCVDDVTDLVCLHARVFGLIMLSCCDGCFVLFLLWFVLCFVFLYC